MRRPARIARFAAALAALMLGACAGVGADVVPPRISLVHLEPVDIKLFEQRYRLTLRVHNTTETPLEIAGMDFIVEINGETFADGDSNEPVSIPAHGESTVDVEVSSTLGRLFDQISKLGERESPSLDYVIEGHVRLEGGERVPYRFEDEFTLFGSRKRIERQRSI